MFPSLLDPAHDALADDICGLAAHVAAAQAELAAKAARFNTTMAWAEGGVRSCAEFLSLNAGLDLGTSHDLIGVGEALASVYADPFTKGVSSQILPFAIMICVLLLRPQGLFGWRVIERL